MVSEACIWGEGKSLYDRGRTRWRGYELRDILNASRREYDFHVVTIISLFCSIALLDGVECRANSTMTC
jgi:hypothetical protein